MKKIALHWQIIIALLLGLGWAIGSSYLGWSEFTLNWIDPWGKIFISLLKMIAVPLVLFSIIKGVSELADISKLGNMGFKTLGIYVLTTLFAVSLGLTLVNSFKPGSLLSEEQLSRNRIQYELWCAESGTEILDDKNVLTDPAYEKYLVDAEKAYESSKTELAKDEKFQNKLKEKNKQESARPLDFVVDMVPSNLFSAFGDNGAMLKVIFFAIFFGVCMLLVPKATVAPLNGFVDSVNAVILKMVDIIMNAAPFFVFALMAGKFAEMAGDNPEVLWETLYSLGGYSLTVLLGLLLMIFLVYPVLMMLVAGKSISYLGFFKRIAPAQFLAFSTSSSAATLPVTMECVKDRVGVSEEVTSFVLPIGATVNMDGTSLYQAVAAIFLAQMHDVDLSMFQQLTIIGTATLASIGSAAVPGAGLVMLMIVLDSVGLNPAWVALILPVDRILDMCRTVVNVTGDTAVATIVAKTEGELNVPDINTLD